MLPVWGHTGHALQLIPDGTAGEENMFTTDQKLLYCMCGSARTYFTFLFVPRNRIVMKALLKVIKG